MKFLYAMVWLFPVIFMIHDFEEIIMIEAWKKKNEKYIKEKNIPYSFEVSTASFSAAVLGIFILFSVLSGFSYIYESYFLWTAMYIGFILHMIFHVISSMVMRRYTPGAATSIPFTLLCLHMLLKSGILLKYNAIGLCITVIILVIIAVVFLGCLHNLMGNIDKLIEMYIKKCTKIN